MGKIIDGLDWKKGSVYSYGFLNMQRAIKDIVNCADSAGVPLVEVLDDIQDALRKETDCNISVTQI